MRLSWIVQAGTAGHPQVYLYMRDGQITYKEKGGSETQGRRLE